MKSKVLELLKHSDDYISGQRICEQLGVSRTAVWKVMNRLREEGYVIDSVNNKVPSCNVSFAYAFTKI